MTVSSLYLSLCSSPSRSLQSHALHATFTQHPLHLYCQLPLPVTGTFKDDFCMTVSCVVQPHPASAAAAAVLVAHASSLGPGGSANTKYNTDGSILTEGLNEMEQGMGQGPLGQIRDVINIAPLVRQQTHGPVSHDSLYMSNL